MNKYRQILELLQKGCPTKKVAQHLHLVNLKSIISNGQIQSYFQIDLEKYSKKPAIINPHLQGCDSHKG